jgi:hypothetical protein
MARHRSLNPFGFTPWPVTFWTLVVYIGLFGLLLIIHTIVPSAPKSPTPIAGINLTEAWSDLQVLTNGYHPYNSRRNDEVRAWLLERIDAILKRNGALKASIDGKLLADSPAIVYDDTRSNLTFASDDSALSVAFTGTNIIVYIRGVLDEPGAFWERSSYASEQRTRAGKSGVLVNAHFDSVPSGYGATDDGVGVVSVLQLISYYTTPGNAPTKGVVALLNNGEEDYLNGAYAFSQHPISKFPHTFLNLEGAGAGGRALLFRSTDTEITRFYKGSPYPFGTVITADGFKRKLVRSDTDYTVFNGLLGMRGLDVAFFEPRSRYHTKEDSTRYTSTKSLWHMLSASIATMDGLTSYTGEEFDGDAPGPGKVSSGSGTDTVWFDILGRVFVVFELHTLFAVAVTLLVVTPIILIGLSAILGKLDKYYLFTGRTDIPESADPIPINGWRGFFRYPVVFVIATAANIGLAFLITKVNAYVVYSSEWAVWR